MIKKKKLALLSVAGILSAVAIGVTVTGSVNPNFIPTFGEDATVWKHYAAVEATETTHGSKEFWASCTPDASGNYGTHVFVAPTTGTIVEGGDIKTTAYWGDIVEGDDRYVGPVDSTITFDARGGVAVTEGKYSYGTEASALPTTTREADDYYDSYEFCGWYKDGVAYDKVEGSATLKAKWKYGEAKKTYICSWGESDFTKGGDVTVKSVSSAAGFDKTDDDGIMFSPSNDDTGTMTAPTINFNEILETHRAVYMSVGGYNSYNKLNVTTSAELTLASNGTEQDVKYLTRMLLRFTKEADGKVHMHYSDTTVEKPNYYSGGYKSYAYDTTLTDNQANGKEGLVFTAAQKGATRLYWLGRPYYINGEEQYLNVSQKTGYTVTYAALKKQNEVSGQAPWGAWTEWVGSLNEYIGLWGNDTSGVSVLTFDSINFSELFEAGKGVRFTIGAWNGGEHVYFGTTDLGVNAAAPAIVDHTVDSIEKTWHNWEVSIDDIGAHIYNKNEGKTYDVALTADQIVGNEGISLQLTKNLSNGRLFLVSNLYTYHF